MAFAASEIPEKEGRMPTIREIVLELANTAEGVSAEDPVVADAGITERQFVTAAKHLVSTGYLFRALVKPHKSRYFAEKRHRDSWVEARYREVQKLILERKHKELARLREKEQALRRGCRRARRCIRAKTACGSSSARLRRASSPGSIPATATPTT